MDCARGGVDRVVRLGVFSLSSSAGTSQPPQSKKAAPVVLVGRPHLVGITALQSGTSCLVRETNSGEIRYNQVLGVRGKEILVTVKGAFSVTSNAIENLTVTIDGFPYKPEEEVYGRQMATFKDVDSVPPPQPPPPSKSAPAKTVPAKAAPTKAPVRSR